MKKRHFLFGGIIMLCMVIFSAANAQSSNDSESAGAFVQKFYDWYVMLYEHPANAKNPTPTDVIAVNKHPEYFDAALRKGLIDDNIAQAKVKDDIVGLDFDPFLASQDSGFEYQTGDVKQMGIKYLVDVRCAEKGKTKKAILAAKTHVIAEVVKSGTGWKFTNFIYPAEGKQKQSNLLQLLANLANERKNPHYK